MRQHPNFLGQKNQNKDVYSLLNGGGGAAGPRLGARVMGACLRRKDLCPTALFANQRETRLGD